MLRRIVLVDEGAVVPELGHRLLRALDPVEAEHRAAGRVDSGGEKRLAEGGDITGANVADRLHHANPSTRRPLRRAGSE